jgi:hypothetical protein
VRVDADGDGAMACGKTFSLIERLYDGIRMAGRRYVGFRVPRSLICA